MAKDAVAPEGSPSVPELEGRLLRVEADFASMVKRLGRMPGTNGVDDPGEGAWKMLWEIRQGQRRTQYMNHTIAALLAALVSIAVPIAKTLAPSSAAPASTSSIPSGR